MSGLLLDTQVVLWAASTPDRLPGRLREALDTSSNPAYVSAVSIAEMTIKQALGKLLLPLPPTDLCAEFGFTELPLGWSHAARVADLPPIHRDPFDRLLLATALVDGLTLVTADRTMLTYPDVQTFAI